MRLAPRQAVMWRKLDIELCDRRERGCPRSAAGSWLFSLPDDNVETLRLGSRSPFEPSRRSAVRDPWPLKVMPARRVELIARVVGDVEDDEVRAERRFGLSGGVMLYSIITLPKKSDTDERNLTASDLDLDGRLDVDMQLPGLRHPFTSPSMSWA
jgi:hypothetical protein